MNLGMVGVGWCFCDICDVSRAWVQVMSVGLGIGYSTCTWCKLVDFY